MNRNSGRNKPIHETNSIPVLSFLSKVQYEDAINNDFIGLVRYWILRLVFVRQRHLIDVDQLSNDVLNDLIKQINNRTDNAVLVRENSIRLCRAITKCHVCNALVFLDRQKRKADCEDIATNSDVADHFEYGPESIAIHKEIRRLILDGLSSQLRRVVEFKLLGWCNSEVANEMSLSIRAIERMLKKIEPTMTTLILNGSHKTPNSKLQTPRGSNQ